MAKKTVNMKNAVGGHCGCPTCVGEGAGPQSRGAWQRRTNKQYHGYGSKGCPCKGGKQRK